MLENLIVIDKDNILEEVNNFKLYGYRFAAMTCDEEEEYFELTYHFDTNDNYKMKHLRMLVKQDDVIKSISPVYPSAFLIENEYQDLYGLKFEGLIIDYKGSLYLTPNSPKTPMIDKEVK